MTGFKRISQAHQIGRQRLERRVVEFSREYSREFRIEAVRMASGHRVTLKLVGTELGVNLPLLGKWLKPMQEGYEQQALPAQVRPRWRVARAKA